VWAYTDVCAVSVFLKIKEYIIKVNLFLKGKTLYITYSPYVDFMLKFLSNKVIKLGMVGS
jgi:hypothetical protein